MEWYKTAAVAAGLVLLAGCRLTVGVSGDGTVTGDKVSCPSDCKAKLKRGKEITLTAAANTGSFFASWNGCDETDGEQCVVVGKNKNRKVTAVFSEDLTLDEAEISEDIKQCATDENSFEDTVKLSAIDRLVCDGSKYGSTFETSGIDKLQNLTYLDISDTTLDTLSAIAELNKLETLKLVNLGLRDVDVLSALNKDTLSSLDLQENANLDCDDAEVLEDKFVDTTLSVPQCDNIGDE